MFDPSRDLHKEGTTPDSLYAPEGNGGGEHIDEGEDEGDEERVGDGTSGLEERGRVVKDKVDTRPLLHHLERSAENGATEITASHPKRASEALEPTGPVASDGDRLSFILGIRDNCGEFRGDVVRVLRLTTKSREHTASALDPVFLDEVTGRLRKEVKTSTQDQTPSKLDADRDTVRSRIRSCLGGVGDTRGEKKTKGNTCAKDDSMIGHNKRVALTELVARDERTTNFSRANFRHVQDDDGGDETNTETGNQTANDNKGETLRSGLENDSNSVDDTARDNGRSTTIPVSEITGNQSTFQQMLSQQQGTKKRNG